MYRLFTSLLLSILASSNVSATDAEAKYENTVCFSQGDCNKKYSYGVLGDKVKLCSGKCNGKTISQMNAEGWRLIQVVNGLQNSFGIVFERIKPQKKNK